ncbi:microcin C7 immunity protein. Serine peptidase. MEROPS family S66 [Actinokineospora alba]|uniref:Microcin C7 immunity protein. Serine peptidase. MEROPS family S66 n=1 Tax=Actinokineospora alba TaxID=504798 RepID=A0A1H0HER8_9PSEU|nr:LD-carboxypeptidase [Actinokineospora alba]TDP64914.1 muramoyltetrapeptide carboxypeptidase [Actinokineospora alba]SDH49261.1 muramoyltetrapeptide carboxypeptidase [Actinokineospora alba]SDO17655.1 microcin C7 immunity protein. Serine peptidase. MEROPS family S66 [Actinokineospora alba]
MGLSSASPRRAAACPPPGLRPGDGARLVSLSGPLAARCPRRLRRAAAALAGNGLRPSLCQTTTEDDGRFAGSAARRAAALTSAFRDPDVAAVITTIGGSGARDLVAHLDPDELAAHPTVFSGYSDSGSLLLWLHERTGMTTFYGPAALPQFGEPDGCDPYTWRHFWAAVSAGAAPGVLRAAEHVVVEFREWDVADDVPRARLPIPGRAVLRPGRATGPLVAANVATLAGDLRAGLVSRPWAGRVVFLEESDTASWADFQDHLAVIAASALLDGAAGVCFGVFRQVVTGEWDRAAVRESLVNLAGACRGPVVSDVEFGHTDPMLCLPLGAVAEVDADADGAVRLCLPEPAVRGRG